ncbi:arrestin domain-containing protein 2-like [Anticarsia gemmatalis]|uniref:arrestin domain-containing protein 2-like n=1 Tax=Anticarsia gemmatalis TaxID=129554 RepID=UPI003F7732C8
MIEEGIEVGFQNGSIRLEQIPNVYYSGQILTGSVVFDLRRPLSISALYIKYLGEANVLWTEYESQSNDDFEGQIEVKYVGHEVYFDYTECLAGGYGVTELPRTYQSFPFRFQIPFTAPSSFKGDKGSITYTITATMVYPDLEKEELTQKFKVVAPLDLNNGNPSIKQPIDMEFEEVYSCCCSSNPVTIKVRLPVSGYCPGQAIPVALEVQNDSSVEITKMIFEILTRERYRSQRPQSDFIPPETVIHKQKRGAIMANTKRNFTYNVYVPHIIPPYLEHCSIIDVGYFFRITIKLSGCNDDLQDETEICLGLVPIQEQLDQEYHHPMADHLPQGPIPVNNGQGPTTIGLPPIALPYAGSNTSINVQNVPQSSQRPIDAPPPYPGLSMPLPGVNVVYPAANSNSKTTYEIGFKLPEGLGSNSNVNVPYPSVRTSPYSSNTAVNNALPSYAEAASAPSAPPSVD